MKRVLLTGDRPTGRLHLGHYVGSLLSRVSMQDSHESYVMVADTQALTDNLGDRDKIASNVLGVVRDYLSVGIDGYKVAIFLQSHITEIFEMANYLLNFVSLARIKQNPTVKWEVSQRGLELSAGFELYPLYQVADIVTFGASVVPVGGDQIPMIELARDVVKRVNDIYGEVLVLPEVMSVTTLPGCDGRKMSKSLGNAIYLSDDEEQVIAKIMKMKSDPNRKSASDPGNPANAVAFNYLEAFADKEVFNRLYHEYSQGSISDRFLKETLIDILIPKLKEISDRGREIDDKEIVKILHDGECRALAKAKSIVRGFKKSIGMDYSFLV